MIFQCPDGSYALTQANGYDVPACNAGSGVWMPDPVPFWEQQLDGQKMADLIAAVLLFACVVWVLRKIGEAIERGHRNGGI